MPMKLVPGKLAKNLSEMFELHLRAHHLPHIRRYHALRKRHLKSYDKTNPKPGKPRRLWTLPLHLVDVVQLHSLDPKSEHQAGWLQFLDWRNGMVGVAQIRRDNVLSSLSTGLSAKAQQRITAGVLSQKNQKKELRIIAVPALHFRALAYVEKATEKKLVVPLKSAIARLQLGRCYTPATIQKKLRVALEHRIQKAREAAERIQSVRRRS